MLPESELARLETHFAARDILVADGSVVSVRTCGPQECALPLVCLHGIGSGAASWLDVALLLGQQVRVIDTGAASWLDVAQLVGQQVRVIAWDAPGYGTSTPLPHDAPSAHDYAERLHALLDAMQVQRCMLIGHSLGAIMAAAAVRMDRVGRFAALMLLSPAQGYGAPGREAERARVHAERMAQLNEQGIAGLAARRSARLLSDSATPLARQWVHWNMARLHERGYRQAIELLCGGDLLADLPVSVPTKVLCGMRDTITPAMGCAEVAAHGKAPFHGIPAVGHACYVEQPAEVVISIAPFYRRVQP